MKNKEKHVHQQGENHPIGNQAAYYCSMHCEGDKTYDQPGDCPSCGMHLVPVKTQAKNQ